MQHDGPNGVEWVAPGVFSLSPEGAAQLLGGSCAACGGRWFPKPDYCPTCLEPAQPCELGSTGAIYSFTVVRIRPPFGLPQPYGVGYVDLDTGLRVFCLLDPDYLEQFEVGGRVGLKVGVLGHDGRGSPCLRPYFAPLFDESTKGAS